MHGKRVFTLAGICGLLVLLLLCSLSIGSARTGLRISRIPSSTTGSSAYMASILSHHRSRP
jgi:hypothetical protein